MFVIILITAKDRTEAERIAERLIKQKLAACVNILDSVHSLFWWEGKLDRADEVLLVIKTRKSLFKKLEKVVKSIHSYDLPEIIAIPVVMGNRKYLEWVGQSTSK